MRATTKVLLEEGGIITVEEVEMVEEEEIEYSLRSVSHAIKWDISPLDALKRLETILGREIGESNCCKKKKMVIAYLPSTPLLPDL